MSLWGAASADAAWGRDDKAFSDNPQAIQDASESVVMLNCYDASGELFCTGSAFAAFAPGVFVTNYHVIEDGIYAIRAQLETGMEFRLTDVVGFDADNDIAILYTDVRTGIKELPIGNTSEMLKGEKVTAIGSPLGLVNTVSVGLYSGIIRDGGSTLLQFSAPISHGSSGGALFNDKGEVVGVTSSSLTDGQNLNFAIPVDIVEELWNRSELSSRMTLEAFSASLVNEVDTIKKAHILRVAVAPDWPYMEFVVSSKSGGDKYVGFDISLARYIANQLKVKLEIVPMEFEECQKAVEDDTVDMSISSYMWTEERAELFELSDPYVPYGEDERVILIRKGETDLLAIVNAALAKASDNRLYYEWYDDARGAFRVANPNYYYGGAWGKFFKQPPLGGR